MAGAGEQGVLPPFTGSIAGYGVRQGIVFEGVHDIPKAKAIYLSSSGEKGGGVAIVSVDLLLINNDLRERVEERIAPLGLRGFILCATHTHSSVGNYSRNLLTQIAATGGFRRESYEWIAEQIAKAVGQAKDNARAARMGWTRSEAPGLNRHRRDKAGETDPEFTLCKIETSGTREPIAYLVSYGAHPTVLGPSNRLITADFPGFLTRKLEREKGGIALFCNAGAAEIAPNPKSGGSDFESARSLGESLAEHCLRVEAHIATSGDPEIQFRSARVLLPGADPRPILGMPFTPLIQPFVSVSVPDVTRLQVLSIGDLHLATFPCDFGAKLGQELKRRGGGTTVPISYADDYVGYVVDEKSYRRGWYEAKLQFYGPRFGEFLLNESLSLFKK